MNCWLWFHFWFQTQILAVDMIMHSMSAHWQIWYQFAYAPNNRLIVLERKEMAIQPLLVLFQGRCQLRFANLGCYRGWFHSQVHDTYKAQHIDDSRCCNVKNSGLNMGHTNGLEFVPFLFDSDCGEITPSEEVASLYKAQTFWNSLYSSQSI